MGMLQQKNFTCTDPGHYDPVIVFFRKALIKVESSFLFLSGCKLTENLEFLSLQDGSIRICA